MNLAQIIQYIEGNIIDNDNKEITAAIMRDVLEKIVQWFDENAGDADDLLIGDNLTDGVNQLFQLIQNIAVDFPLDVHNGADNPNINPPSNFSSPDIYVRTNPNQVYIFNGDEWVLLIDNDTVQNVAILNRSEFSQIGIDDVLYVAKDELKLYLWDGDDYVEFQSGGSNDIIHGTYIDPTTFEDENGDPVILEQGKLYNDGADWYVFDGSELNKISDTSVYVNIKDFGAKGDDSTDDTQAIQNAIDYAHDNNKWVYIPNGTYLLSYGNEKQRGEWGYPGPRDSMAYCIHIYDGTKIIGQSRNDSIFKVTEDSVDDAIAKNTERSSYIIEPFEHSQDDVWLENFTVDGNRRDVVEYYSEMDGLHLSGLRQKVFQVRVINVLGDAIDLDEGSVFVSEFESDNCGTGVNSNVDEGGERNVFTRIINSDIRNSINNGIKARTELLDVQGCTFLNNATGDISFNSNSNFHESETFRIVNIKNNSFLGGNGTSYIKMGVTVVSTNVNVSGNVFSGDISRVFTLESTHDEDKTLNVVFYDNNIEEYISIISPKASNTNYTIFINGNSFYNGFLESGNEWHNGNYGNLILGDNVIRNELDGNARKIDLGGFTDNVIVLNIKKTSAIGGDGLLGTLYTYANTNGGNTNERSANFGKYEVNLGIASNNWFGSLVKSIGDMPTQRQVKLVEYEKEGDTWIGLSIKNIAASRKPRGGYFIKGYAQGEINYDFVLESEVTNVVDFIPDVPAYFEGRPGDGMEFKTPADFMSSDYEGLLSKEITLTPSQIINYSSPILAIEAVEDKIIVPEYFVLKLDDNGDSYDEVTNRMALIYESNSFYDSHMTNITSSSNEDLTRQSPSLAGKMGDLKENEGIYIWLDQTSIPTTGSLNLKIRIYYRVVDLVLPF